MITPELDQVCIPPDQAGTFMAIKKLVDAEEPPRLTRRLRFRVTLGRVLHPLGIHHWVRWRQYDPGSNRLLEMGWTCHDCNVGRR